MDNQLVPTFLNDYKRKRRREKVEKVSRIWLRLNIVFKNVLPVLCSVCCDKRQLLTTELTSRFPCLAA